MPGAWPAPPSLGCPRSSAAPRKRALVFCLLQASHAGRMACAAVARLPPQLRGALQAGVQELRDGRVHPRAPKGPDALQERHVPAPAPRATPTYISLVNTPSMRAQRARRPPGTPHALPCSHKDPTSRFVTSPLRLPMLSEALRGWYSFAGRHTSRCVSPSDPCSPSRLQALQRDGTSSARPGSGATRRDRPHTTSFFVVGSGFERRALAHLGVTASSVCGFLAQSAAGRRPRNRFHPANPKIHAQLL